MEHDRKKPRDVEAQRGHAHFRWAAREISVGDRSALPHTGKYTKHMTLEEVERTHIVSVLKDTNWVLFGPKGAAARLGLKRTTLEYRMKKLGIVRPGKQIGQE